jgi:hypothetical protein
MWLEIGVVALLLCGVSAFGPRAGGRGRMLTRKTGRWARGMYHQFAGARRERPASEHGSTSRDGQAPSGSPR